MPIFFWAKPEIFESMHVPKVLLSGNHKEIEKWKSENSLLQTFFRRPDLLDKKKPAEYNQAIMEFGALQCIPKSPKCETCPFNKQCVAFNTNEVLNLPVKSKKIRIKERKVDLSKSERFFASCREYFNTRCGYC